jgi:hypothetical protein
VFSAIKYQWQVWRLNRQMDNVERHYRSKDAPDAPQVSFNQEEWQAKHAVWLKIARLETAYLLRRASREKVPTPDYEDEQSWIETKAEGFYLSEHGYANLRAAIRKERNEKWDFRLKVLGLLGSTAIGTIGALIGLVTALKK